MYLRKRVLELLSILFFLMALFVMSVPHRCSCQRHATVAEYINLGLNDSDHYRFESAFRWLETARQLAPLSAAPYKALGKYFYRRHDYVQAIDSFIHAAQFAPSDSEALYYAGLLRLRLKSARMAGTCLFFERAYQLDSKNYLALKEWARLKASIEGKGAAMALIRKRLAREPRNPWLLWIEGEIMTSVGEPSKAVPLYERALTIDAKAAAVKISLGNALRATGDSERAVAQYWLAALLDPKYTEGFYRAADTMLARKDLVQAESMAHYLIQVAPDYPGAYQLLARIYHQGERHDLQVDAMEQEVAHHPENLTDQVNLADAYISVGRFDQAITVLKRVTSISLEAIREPDYIGDWVRAYVVLSKAYRGIKRYDAAENAARIASRIDGRSLYIRREMAYVKAGLDFGN